MATTNPGTFELAAIELGRALEPIADRLHDAHHALILLAELGLELPTNAVSPALQNAFNDAHQAAHKLPNLLSDLVTAIDGGDALDIIAKGVPVAEQVAKLISAFDVIGNQVSGLGAIPGINPADLAAFSAALPRRLFETVLSEYLEGYHRLVFTMLEFGGILERIRQNIGSSDPSKPEFVRRQLRLDRIGTLLQSPDQLFRDLYGWGQGSFDGNLVIQRIGTLFRALRIPVTYTQLPGPPPRLALEVCVFTLAPTKGLNPPGLELTLTENIASGFSLDLPFAAGWIAHLGAEGSLQAKAGVRIQPPAAVSVIPPSGMAQGRLKAGIAHVPVSPATNFVLLAVAGGTGLTAERLGFNLTSGFQWDTGSGQGRGDLGFEGEIAGGKLRIGMDGADGFLAKILSGFSVEADFNLGFGWSSNQGVYFQGSSTLEIQLPAHISLGPVELDALTLKVGIDGQKFPILLAVNIKAMLGPLQGVVEQLGAGVALEFPANGKGDIGPLSVAFAFQPPKGVGLSLDVGVVKGGGYLFIDAERGEYAGALELSLFEIVTISAIGIITTKMPDGSKGFSLLILMSVEFGTGIQLGFGFTLLAVGGLVGLNRTMNLQALAEGVRSGAIESVMFPRDIVANAPKIISDLKQFFPPYEGKFLIGPMVKIGWGTPTLISVSLGIIIEIPGNIAIVGVIKIALPTEDADLIRLQVNFIGAIEFDKSRLWFFAALFDSRIIFLTIEGEMGLLIAWGDDANFVISVGGFHPRFSPPPLPFPSPKRIAVSLINTSVARIRVEGYFAVTSNTVQFGAKAEVHFGISIASVEGHLGFDALFQFSPFHFIIEISASFSVKLFGFGLFSIGFSGLLEGPSDWHVKGKGSISILFWDIDVEFETRWGEKRNTDLPPIAVMPIIEGELNKNENWKALLPATGALFVSLRAMTPDEAALILHPVGVLHISQRALPLELMLDKVGNQKPSDVNKLSVSLAPGGLAKKNDTVEQFAPAQFQNFSDSEKLSRPAFGPEKSGLDLSASGADLRSSVAVKRIVRYEEIILDSNFKRFARKFRAYAGTLFNFFLNGNAAARCELSRATKKKLDPFEEKITVRPDTYTVALQSNNKAYSAEAASFTSEASAREFLRVKSLEDPTLADELHVIPTFERAA